MKLIKQVSLWFQEGTSDKIYEVDLCEVGTDKFVVNFRYGRRGAALKDGTKTALPVTESEATKIYNQLVGSKTAEGYEIVSSFGGITTQPINFKAVIPEPVIDNTINLLTDTTPHTALEKYVLDCLKEAVKPQGILKKNIKWSLSRIVWRVGELRLRAAVPTLVSIIPQSPPLQQYSIAWALGRCGESLAISTLSQLSRAAASKDFVRQMANWSLFELQTGEALQKMQADLLSLMPPNLAQAVVEGNTEGYQKAFDALPRNLVFPRHLSVLYQLSKHFPVILNSIHAALITLPFKGSNHFKAVRQILKIAELRDDFKTLAVLSYCIENKPAFFNSQSYYAYVDNDYIYDASKEMKKSDSRLGYSQLTRQYLRRRSWRILRTLGESENWADYTHLATEHLLQFKDSDMTQAQSITKSQWHWDDRARNYTQTTSETHYKSNAHFLSFNKILFGKSERFELTASGKAFKVKEGQSETAPVSQREEAFSKAWNAQPEALIRLLKESACRPVHQFAVKAVRANPNVLEALSIADIKQILRAPYLETVELCVDLAKQRFNPLMPDIELVLALMECPIAQARELAYQWVNQNPSFYQLKPEFIITAFQSQHIENLSFIDNFLNRYPLSISDAKRVIEGVLTPFLEGYTSFDENNATHTSEDERLKTVINVFLNIFSKELSVINLAIPNVLLNKPYPMLQTLGARMILNHNTPAEQLPDGMIGALVNSRVKEVRETGVRIFGKLPDSVLYNSEETLKSFCLSPFGEIRAAIRPTIQRLAQNKEGFGRHWVDEMMPFFRMTEHYEGLHHDLYLLFTESLGNHLAHLGTESALKWLQSSLVPRQLLGVYLLQNTVDSQELTMRQITKLADHEMLAVREWAQNFYQTHISRIKYEAAEALRILDAKWDDARQFFFQFFRTEFSEADWTPDLLVFICDSTRYDVQQFGKEMITRFFKEENGSRYLMQLSQHPSVNLQNFATHYLEQFAANQPEYLVRLEHYFVTILSQVNRSGVAKARIFQFLQQEGLKNETVATMIARIMSRQSATMAVADKAACLKVMMALKMTYPNMEMAMQVMEYRQYG